MSDTNHLSEVLAATLREFETAAHQADQRGQNAPLRQLRESLCKDSTPPIAAMLRLSDTLTEALLWLAENRPELVRPHAATRFTWPAQVSLSAHVESPFRALVGKHDKFGERTDVGPIGLGAKLPFRVNRKTQGGLLYRVATRAVIKLFTPAWRDDWVTLCFETMPAYRKWRAGRKTVSEWLDSLGPLTERTWFRQPDGWQAVFDRYVTVCYGPVPKRICCVAQARRADPQFTASLSEPPIYLCHDIPEIRAVCAGCKTDERCWGAVKHRILKKIEAMRLR